MTAGMPTRFDLANLLSNTYNVPIWAHVKMDVYYKTPHPSYTKVSSDKPSGSSVEGVDAVTRMLMTARTRVAPHTPLSLSSSSHVPNVVLPLLLPGQPDNEGLTSISGTSDRYGLSDTTRVHK